MKDFLEAFSNPLVDFRVKPFWFWHSRSDADTIAFHIRRFKEMVLDDFFMHVRFGLETPICPTSGWKLSKQRSLKQKSKTLKYGCMTKILFQAVLETL